MVRPNETNFLLNYGALTSQYMLDMWIRNESNIFAYQERNQELLNRRRDTYNNVKESKGDLEDVGTKVTMTKSIPGTPKWLHDRYEAVCALYCYFGKPSIFLTFTANPHWDEIKDCAMMGNVSKQNPKFRPDMVCRVFEAKRAMVENDVFKNGIFGQCLGFCYVIEFQKRGLPHCHMLIWLKEEDHLDTPEKIDACISAEIPPESNPELRQKVLSLHLHNPCGEHNPYAPCMKEINGVRR